MFGDDDTGDDTWLYGCVKQPKQRDPMEGKIKLIWQDGQRTSTLRYQHMTYHHYTDEKPNSIRLKGLHDEAIIEGYDLHILEKLLDEEKIMCLRQYVPTDADRGGGQPVVLKITVRDRM